MTTWCETCPGELFPVDVLTGHATCVECERRSIAAATRNGKQSEWSIFMAALREAAVDGVVRANDVRPLIRGRIFHKHIGKFYVDAKKKGVLVPLHREQSRDTAGKNTHHDSGVYELRVAA